MSYKCFNVTVLMFGKNFQGNDDSKQQIVITTNLSELLTLNKCLKGFAILLLSYRTEKFLKTEVLIATFSQTCTLKS